MQKATNVYNKNDLNKNEEEVYIGDKIPYKEILNYLNQVTGKQYRASTKKNQELIRARWNEGFREGDFFRVIDNKAQTWQGTEMDKFLRPATLFGTKFEGYLNEIPQFDNIKKGGIMNDFQRAHAELQAELREMEDDI